MVTIHLVGVDTHALGRIEANGKMYDAEQGGHYIADVDPTGKVYDVTNAGRYAGRITDDGSVYNQDTPPHVVGRVDADGQVYTSADATHPLLRTDPPERLAGGAALLLIKHLSISKEHQLQVVPASTHLVATMQSPPTKLCPFCSEEIQSTATKCRYCSEWLITATQASANTYTVQSGGSETSWERSSTSQPLTQQIAPPIVASSAGPLYCPTCDTERSGGKYCPFCQTPLLRNRAPGQTLESNWRPPNSALFKESSFDPSAAIKSFKWIFLVVGILLVAFLYDPWGRDYTLVGCLTRSEPFKWMFCNISGIVIGIVAAGVVGFIVGSVIDSVLQKRN